MRPAVLRCEPCGLRFEGVFVANEFASLSQEDLHFLRIFIHTEGRIRDMESALGVSYPTVKARLAELKERLKSDLAATAPVPAAPEMVTDRPETDESEGVTKPGDVLGELEAGNITVEQAIERLRAKKGS